MGSALVSGFTGLVYLADRQRARDYDMSVREFRDAQFDIYRPRLLWALLFEQMSRSVSSGGGGPGESPISTDPPPPLHQTESIDPGLHGQGQPVPVVVPAASISAHGGGRSGAKPRKRCPPGYTWSKTKRKCVRVWSFRGGRKY
jgi:hypothetical protein